jgi:hypothetical protein
MTFRRAVARASWLGLAVACTPHAVQRSPTATVPTVLLVGTSPPARITNEAPAEGDAECIVTDVRVGIDATIEPKGVDPFRVRLRKLPMRIRIEKGHAMTVFVSGPIELVAHTAISNGHDYDSVGLFTRREVVFAEGLVRVAPGHYLKDFRPHGAYVASKVVFGDADVEGIDVSCDGLAVGEGITIEPVDVDIDEEAAVLEAKGPTAQVCTDANATTCVTVPKELPLVPGTALNGFIEVRTPFKDGSVIHGWARRSELVSSDVRPSIGYGASGGCGCGSSYGRSHRNPPDPREHYGEAHLVVGAKIFATPEGRGEWAKVKSPIVATIAMGREDGFAKITALTGISTTTGCDCDGIEDHAYIAREAVKPIR